MGITSNNNHVFIVMGVSGTGKTAVSKIVSQQMDAALLDGDFLHSRSDITKMSTGNPLTDEDRMPWLVALNDAIFAMQRSEKISLLICSALKKKYRDVLRENNENLSFLHMKGDFALIEERMKKRQGHFFTAEMLASQFRDLEEPDDSETDVYSIDITPSVGVVAEDVIQTIRSVVA